MGTHTVSSLLLLPAHAGAGDGQEARWLRVRGTGLGSTGLDGGRAPRGAGSTCHTRAGQLLPVHREAALVKAGKCGGEGRGAAQGRIARGVHAQGRRRDPRGLGAPGRRRRRSQHRLAWRLAQRGTNQPQAHMS